MNYTNHNNWNTFYLLTCHNKITQPSTSSSLSPSSCVSSNSNWLISSSSCTSSKQQKSPLKVLSVSWTRSTKISWSSGKFVSSHVAGSNTVGSSATFWTLNTHSVLSEPFWETVHDRPVLWRLLLPVLCLLAAANLLGLEWCNYCLYNALFVFEYHRPNIRLPCLFVICLSPRFFAAFQQNWITWSYVNQ